MLVETQPIRQEPKKVQSVVLYGRLAIRAGGIIIRPTSIRRSTGKIILNM